MARDNELLQAMYAHGLGRLLPQGALMLPETETGTKASRGDCARVLVYLAAQVDRTGVAYPGQRTTEHATGIHRRTLRMALKQLTYLGLIAPVKRGPGERQKFVVLPNLLWADIMDSAPATSGADPDASVWATDPAYCAKHGSDFNHPEPCLGCRDAKAYRKTPAYNDHLAESARAAAAVQREAAMKRQTSRREDVTIDLRSRCEFVDDGAASRGDDPQWRLCKTCGLPARHPKHAPAVAPPT
jgi:hypothetical protein